MNFSTIMPYKSRAGVLHGCELSAGSPHIPSVGSAIFGNEVAIRVNGSPTLTGEIGEVVIRGHSVMSGYADNPTATEDSFADGWFHTGDLGFVVPSSEYPGHSLLYITGRIKNVVKCAGASISLDELDRAALGIAEVDDACAASRPDAHRGEAVTMFYVARPDSELDPQLVREACAQVASPSLMGLRVVRLQAIPRLRSGKPNRRLLASRAAKDAGTQQSSLGVAVTRSHDDRSFERLASRFRQVAEELRPSSCRDREPGKLLLTGASGFFGRNLLKQIAIAMPDQEIYCLVRDDSGFSPDISDIGAPERILPLVGDLSLPCLGLSAEEWQKLGREVATIVHAGGEVNHFLPFERVVETNVSGTLALLRLAGECRNKRMHFISSISSLGRSNARNCADRVPPQPPSGGYAQSKWLAESLIEICQGAGFDVSTYRVGGLGPDTNTGEVNLKDWRWLTMRAALESGLWPACHGGPRWLPVDVAARMVTSVVANDSDPAARYHLLAPTGPTWEAVLKEMIRLGYNLEKVERDTWFDMMRNRAKTRDETSMKVLALGLPHQVKSESAAQAEDAGAGAEPIGGVHPESWKPEDLPITIRWTTERGFLQARTASPGGPGDLTPWLPQNGA
jgi:thioester reductase-like protein